MTYSSDILIASYLAPIRLIRGHYCEVIYIDYVSSGIKDILNSHNRQEAYFHLIYTCVGN